MNQSITYILRGVYFGLGFAIIVFFAAQASSIYTEKRHKELQGELIEVYKGQEVNMVINIISSQYSDKGMTTLLEITNNNKNPVYAFTAEVEYFNEKGIFIGECSTYTIKSINPGTSENIEIFCREKWEGWLKKAASTKAKLKNETKGLGFSLLNT